VSFHDVAFTDDGPTEIPPEFVADAPRDPLGPGEIEVFAVEYRFVAGQSRQKGNRWMSAVRKPAKGVEVLYSTADGRRGAHKRFWRDAVDRHFRASLGIPPSDLEPLADDRRYRVRDALQVAHHDHLPESDSSRSECCPGFTRASVLATGGGHPDDPQKSIARERERETSADALESPTIQSTERALGSGGER